jgi:hypothetical protein
MLNLRGVIDRQLTVPTIQLNNIAALRALDPPFNTPETQVFALLKVGGLFYWQPDSTGTDDSFNVITPTNSMGAGRWLKYQLGAVEVLGLNGAATARNSQNNPTDATFVSMGNVTVPAGVMGANGMLRIDATYSFTSSASTKNVEIRFGGSAAYTSSFTTNTGVRLQLLIQNRNSTSSQANSLSLGGQSQFGSSTATVPLTLSINTANSQTIEMGGYWGAGVATENITLQRYSVELLRS